MALSTISPQTGKPLTNAEIHRLLGVRISRDLLGAMDDGLLEIGPLISNYFSFTFSIKADAPDGERNVFVKIPKVDMRGVVPSILPLTRGDREMAREEASSLGLLGRKWDGDDLEVSWVNLCGVVPEYNAVVTDRIFADEAFAVFRRLDLRRRLGLRQEAQRLRRSMARIGTALGRFHETAARTAVFKFSEARPKMELYCRKLAVSTGSSSPEGILRKLHSIGEMELPTLEVPTLKGLDIRNILTDSKDRFYLLDPGKIKPAFKEADLARFIVTYRLLHWGSPGLLLFREPDRLAETAFLNAYYANVPFTSGKVLNVYILKEQLKHWHNIIGYVQRCSWPKALKKLAVQIYVNPFFCRCLKVELERLREV